MTSILHKIAAIQCYILHKTDKEVNIEIPRTVRQFHLLDKAYNQIHGLDS